MSQRVVTVSEHLPRRRPRSSVARGLVGAAIVAGAALALATLAACRQPAGPPPDPTSGTANHAPQTPAVGPLAPQPNDHQLAATLQGALGPGRLLVVGWDGADWELLDRFLAAGRMPHLAGLLAGGARGVHVATPPLLSPLLWTSMVTGVEPPRHGVLDFFERGESGSTQLVSAASRQVPALWDLLGAIGEPSVVLGWWATHPAPPVRGLLVSDRLTLTVFPGIASDDLEAAVWPPERTAWVATRWVVAGQLAPQLIGELTTIPTAEAASRRDQALAGPPDDPLRLLLETVAAGMTTTRLAVDGWSELAPRALLAYYEGPDAIGHLFAPYLAPPLPGSDAAAVRRFGATPDAYYSWLDRELGKLAAMLSPTDSLVLLADHGFRWGRDRPTTGESGTLTRSAVLWHRPPGAFVVAGAVARPGGRGQLSTPDVLPTLLATLGLPPARDLSGRAASWALRDTPAAAADRPKSIDWALGELVDAPTQRPALLSATQTSPASEAEAVARLRALGYVGGGELTSSAVSAEPLTTGGLNNLGAWALAKGDLSIAENAFRRAIASDPTYPGAYQNLANVLLQSNRPRDAARAFLLAFDRGAARSEEAAIELALALVERDEPQLAIDLLTTATSKRPDSYLLALNLGTLFGRQQRLPEALAAFRRATELAPGNAVGWRNRAVAAAAVGEATEADAAARSSLAIDRNQPELQQLLRR